MSSLTGIIKQAIAQEGPMEIETFMGLALGHPEHGYYMKHDPLGRTGDFTTAPEISQMFGEMIGAWAADTWMKMGSPASFALVECGPGRGTLMADLMRATKNVPGFHEAAEIHLVEMSPALREKQQEALEGYKVHWHGALDEVPSDRPLILLANEFLDALPVRQAVYAGQQWRKRMVALGEDGDLVFKAGDAADISVAVEPGPFAGDILEDNPAGKSFMAALARRLARQGGAALLIDYGYVGPAIGETLQAIKQHRYTDVFTDIGNADLTAHVDFGAMARAAQEAGQGIRVFGPLPQGLFLKTLGIAARLEKLLGNASEEQKKELIGAYQRLTSPDAMGSLFKVMALADKSIYLAGF